jgi:hypothetical protein
MDVSKILGKFLGNKADRDMREVTPYVEKIKEAYAPLLELSNDQLREKSAGLKQRVADFVAEDKKILEELKAKAEDPEGDVSEKEGIYKEIDSLEEKIDESYEVVLNEILPEAFALIKETARRFKEHEEIEVTALDYDRTLAASRDSIEIKGNRAIWQNRWMAGGNEITWDMVHYDVQLIGGVALHSGKIAEMATGEGKTLVATLPVSSMRSPGKGCIWSPSMITWPRGTPNGWGPSMNFTDLQWIALTSTSPIRRPEGKPITAISPLGPTTNSALTTSVTIWRTVRPNWYKGNTTMPLWMRWIRCWWMMREPR